MHVLRQAIDDVVKADVNLLRVRQMPCAWLHPGAEPDDDGLGGSREEHVSFVNGAGAGVDYVHLALGGVELLQRAAHSIHSSLHIRLDDQVEIGDLSCANPAGGALQGWAGHGSSLSLQPAPTLLYQVLGGLLVRDYPQRVSGQWQLTQAQYLDRG